MTIDEMIQAVRINVTELADPAVASYGLHVHSGWTETFWLPLIGPSTLLLWRRLEWHWRDAGGNYSVDRVSLSESIGLSGRTEGRNSKINRTLARLIQFNLAAPAGDHLAVRTWAPPLSRGLQSRLPIFLTGVYDRATAEASISKRAAA